MSAGLIEAPATQSDQLEDTLDVVDELTHAVGFLGDRLRRLGALEALARGVRAHHERYHADPFSVCPLEICREAAALLG